MKKLNSKGFMHHFVMFAILVLVLGAMGFAGYRVWQNKNIDAQASGYVNVGRYTSFNPYTNINKGTLPFGKARVAGTYRLCVASNLDGQGLKSGYVNVVGSFAARLSVKAAYPSGAPSAVSCTPGRKIAKNANIAVTLTPTTEILVNVYLQRLNSTSK